MGWSRSRLAAIGRACDHVRVRLSPPGLLIAGFGLFFCVVVLSAIAVAVRGRRARLRAAAAYREWLDQALGAWSAANGWQFHAGEVAAP